MREFSVPKEFENYRLDIFIAKKLPALSRSFVQKIIKSGKVFVNGKKTEKVSHVLLRNDRVEVDIPAPKRTEVVAEDIALDIVYEDKDLIVINKPAGMVVHPAHGNYSGTLVNALLSHCRDLSGIGGIERPGIVHRLDKETSGLVVVAKTDIAHRRLSNMFKNRRITKKYLALVHGNVKKDAGTICAPIGRSSSDRKKMSVILIESEKEQRENERKPRRSKSREAITHYKVLKRFKNSTTLLELTPETGRTHQIRVHLSHIHHPIVGDSVYGLKKDKSKYMYLNAYKLGFEHPITRKYLEFKKVDERFEGWVEK